MSTFKPQHISFADGVERIDEALAKVGYKKNSRILTSRDKEAVALCNLLGVPREQLPAGFTKWQLPFYLDGGQFFITSTAPNAEVDEHSHDNDGVRFIMSGSVYYDGIELNAGDWMYIPKEKRYSLQVGPLGASMCYCYACCCAGRELNKSDVINPESFVRGRNSLQ
ncbi:hypothetical protein IWW34DRAFT_744967 [Fusarium oxysporum f. sp. albedinis]|uniref:Cupin 2 conserved barrel domain-containing protein n=3 Tax=Fusarium oxysporum TaxID=5507 RepID=A0A4Q2VFF6_FUSOX|nr:uncharacterized protein FOBCDRAFT_198043 [Fusarium oxysporum Fo47]EWZ80939.1 hypothetical protein FOWG_14946 [Fusarium oxysporum f. sp. lycopersici MN25]KAI3577521.1 hypothetical protein IWW34DRAFT_744967 [Fusarium oxysporum f. sp. albedinis]KAJ4154673.1 hypothetical protein NW765_015707 [Fusarium oxysporum]RKK21786.1 hypothetical protein BFJ65_g4416 [Fusarium oxysporum f. sp. cepae]RYC84039.1 hypothetical protein BFJ63_vAg13062 [Fusarium oxysporum f. sp. narcissi]